MMDLETPDDPTPVPATPEPAPVAAVPEPAPIVPADPDDAAATDVQGQKMVPLAALKAAREEAKSLKDRAADADQLRQYVQQVKPYVDVLMANPNLLRGPQQPAPAPAPAEADPDLVELARSLDYYKADGSPDLARAKTHDALIEKKAQKIARQLVQPVAQSHAKQQSDGNWHVVVQQKLPNGQAINPQLLAKYWQSLPIEHTADRRVAEVAWSLAAVEQMKNSPLPQAVIAPPAPVLHTEPAGGGPRRTAALSPIEQLVTAARGIDAGKYQDLTKGFTAGRTSALED